MLASNLLQSGGWAFDPLSALIGALIAWIIAAALYLNRAKVVALKDKALAPFHKIKAQAQASQEEKYLATLQKRLKSLLLFNPESPEAIFQPPTFLTRAPLPEKLPPDGELPPPLEIQFAHLTDGHTRVVITGPLASGRTTALAMIVWQTQQRAPEEQPFERFPVWVDLAQLNDLPQVPPDQESSPTERFAHLATLFLPELLPKWLIEHLQTAPSLVLVDNWETLPAADRNEVAYWFAEVARAFPQSTWLIASGTAGYGPLNEVGFVPAEIVPPTGEMVVHKLYAGWQRLLDKPPTEDQEDALATLNWASAAGGSLLEVSLRIVAYLQTGQLPLRPVDVVDYYLETRIPTPDMGEEQEAVADQARMVALSTLSYVATTYRLEGRAFTRQEIQDYITALLPPEEERPPKLEGAARKLLFDSRMLTRSAKHLIPAHYLWADFLTAWILTEEEGGLATIQAHLNDPTWTLLIEFFVGLSDATPLVKALLNRVARQNDRQALLRLARWSVIAPEGIAWHQAVMKALAQVVMMPKIGEPLRIGLGRGLALTAGENSKAFFLKALRHPAVEIRCLALRGLGWVGSSREMDILSGAIQDENLAVGEAAIEALADMDTPGAARALSDALSQADDRLILPISKALGRMVNGHKILQESVEHPDLLVRRAAAHGLGLIDQPWAGDLLQSLVREDSEWLVRSAAESALDTQKERAEARNLVPPPPQLDQIAWLMAWAARQGTGLGLGEAAYEMLTSAVRKGDREAQVLGVLTLSYIGHAEHLSDLEPLLEAQDPLVQQAARYAIESIESRYRILE